MPLKKGGSASADPFHTQASAFNTASVASRLPHYNRQDGLFFVRSHVGFPTIVVQVAFATADANAFENPGGGLFRGQSGSPNQCTSKPGNLMDNRRGPLEERIINDQMV